MIEHEDHQDNALGELPRSTRVNRREIYGREVPDLGPPGIVDYVPGNAPAPPLSPPSLPLPYDVERQNITFDEARRAPDGLPPVDFLVQSVFDARPINGNDFYDLQVIGINPNDDPPINSQSFSFTVPDGRLAILRRIEWTTTHLLAIPDINPNDGDDITNISPVFFTWDISTAVQPTYEKIFQQEGILDVYGIAFEKEKITIKVTSNPSFSGDITNYQPNFFVKLYGNLINTQGREKQYEPANKYENGVLK